MALKADHSDLPADAGGWKPDAEPRYLRLFAEAWRSRVEASWSKPIAGGTRMRLSKVGACARDTGYFLAGLADSNPPTVADYWRMGLGTHLHDEVVLPALEAALHDKLGASATIEHLVNLADRDDEWKAEVSGRIDLFHVRGATGPRGGASLEDGTPLALDDVSTVVELKTINGFGWKMMCGARGAAEGPKANHVRQAAIAALALDADEVVILYLSMENLSPREADKIGVDDLGRFGGEWTIPRDQWEPIAQAEIRRQQRIAEIVDKGEMPPRSMPDIPAKARVTDPSKGLWTIEINGEVVQSGSTWMCGYCRNRDRCIEDGAS